MVNARRCRASRAVACRDPGPALWELIANHESSNVNWYASTSSPLMLIGNSCETGPRLLTGARYPRVGVCAGADIQAVPNGLNTRRYRAGETPVRRLNRRLKNDGSS